MSVKLEIVNNYIKITDGSNSPIRYPYRQTRFSADEINEKITLYSLKSVNPLLKTFPYSDEPATGSVNIDAVAPTKASATVQLANAVALALANATIQLNTALANAFSTATAQCTNVVGAAFADGTVVCATVTEGQSVIANGLVYVAVDGVKADNTEFNMSGTNDETATDLADSITNDSRSGDVDDVTAVAVTDTVTITSTVRGTDGNTIPLSSSDGATLAVSGAFLTGGVVGHTVTINGNLFTGVVDVKDDNTQFSVDTGDNETAADLEDSINNDVRVGTLEAVSGNASTNTVTLTSSELGTAGDPTTLTQTGGTIAISGATFSGGVTADIITVNNLPYTAIAGSKAADNTKFSIDTSNDAAATDLADSITNDGREGVKDDVIGSATTDTVTCTQTVGGVGGNATTLTSTGGGRVILSGATFANGTDADWFEANNLIYTAISGSKAGDNTKFDVSGTDIQGATDLADSITNDDREGVLNDCTAASGGTDTVTATTSIGGVVGNPTTLSSSDEAGRLTISGSLFTGGLDNAQITMITVDSVEIMSGAETSEEDADILAGLTADNINAHDSTPNYTAVAVDEKITITAETEDTDVNGFVVSTTDSNATTTDVNMADATANIVDSAGDPFDTWSDLITWLEKKTGGTVIS